MLKSNTYIYELNNKLYINLTNQCSNDCDFCVRKRETYGGHALWLESEPSAQTVIAELEKCNETYVEAVFCGYGEPFCALNELLKVAAYLKSRNFRVRVNTNGQANLINGYDVVPKLIGEIDKINVSLNASDAKKYQDICHSKFGETAFSELLDFAQKCQRAGIKTNLSVVDCIGKDEIAICQKVADSVNLPLKVRKEE